MLAKEVEIFIVDVVNGFSVFSNVDTHERLPVSKVEASIAYGTAELVVTGAAFRILSDCNWIQSHLHGKLN
jgi:hypothetical protein